MKNDSGGHIWPAYADLMTVLLLVYVLISLLFSTLIKVDVEDSFQQEIESIKNNQIQNIISQIQESELKEKLQQILSKNDSQVNIEEKDMISASKSSLIDENAHMLIPQENDLVLSSLKNDFYLSQENKQAIKQWYIQHQQQIEQFGIDFALIIPKSNDISISSSYRKQYVAYIDTLSYLAQEYHSFTKSSLINSSPKPVDTTKTKTIILRARNAQK